MIQKLEMTVLIDNISKEPLDSEWGLSIMIEADDKKILLDTGASGLYAKNAESLRIDLGLVDIGVLSHAHYDHADGMDTFFALNKACHSIVFAAEQMEKERPMAIMGLFDISQRSKALSGMLSDCMPYSLWVGLSENLEKSCLTSHSWKMIEERMQLAQ